jgi:hypothetical protein
MRATDTVEIGSTGLLVTLKNFGLIDGAQRPPQPDRGVEELARA